MRRLLVTTVAAFALVASSAQAASPHFVRASASGPDNAGELDVNFKIAGLGDSETLTITASADATALYACKNHGNNFPQDPAKQEVSGPVSSSGDFTSGKNGQITGTLTLSPPSTTLTCPGNQRVVLVSVSYTNVTVSAPSVGTEVILGTFARDDYEPNFPG